MLLWADTWDLAILSLVRLIVLVLVLLLASLPATPALRRYRGGHIILVMSRTRVCPILFLLTTGLAVLLTAYHETY